MVEQAIAAELMKFGGVAYAVSSTALRTGSLPDTLLMRSILRNFHPKRSGDVYLVFEPNVFINDFDGLTVASTHGSPWRYDTFVPVIFAGAGLPGMTVGESDISLERAKQNVRAVGDASAALCTAGSTIHSRAD